MFDQQVMHLTPPVRTRLLKRYVRGEGEEGRGRGGGGEEEEEEEEEE